MQRVTTGKCISEVTASPASKTVCRGLMTELLYLFWLPQNILLNLGQGHHLKNFKYTHFIIFFYLSVKN